MPRIRRAQVDDEVATTYSDLDRDTRSVDFLKDPELFKDPLPQPYRRIDKILQELFDDVWQIVNKKDLAKRIEASKPRPNKYSSGSIIQDVDQFCCMCLSSDDANEYIFLGSNQGVLTCVDAAGMCTLAQTDLSSQLAVEHVKIVSISSAHLRGSFHLVSCISDTGCLFLSIFSGLRFFPVQSLVDQSGGAEKKAFRKLEISRNCDFLAVLVESRNETYIEVYKCPRDVWSQMAEDMSRARTAQNQRASCVDGDVNQSVSPGDAETTTTTTAATELTTAQDVGSKSQATVDLPKPSMTCRIRPSLNQIKFPTVSQGLTPAQLFKSVEANGDLIGIGVNSCITRAYVDVKTQFVEKAFDVRFDEETIAQLNGTKNYDLKIDADFKFLTSNRFMPSELSIISPDLPICLAVCWNHSNQLLFYPLAKINKELESKFEYTLSFASAIEQIELTKCLTRAAFVLRNNNLIVVNFNSGLSSCCDVSFASNESLDSVAFVPINAVESSPTQTMSLSPQLNVSARLIGLTNLGRVLSIDTSDASTYARCVFQPQLANKDDKLMFITPIRNIPGLMVAISVTQKIFILDIDSGKLICELAAVSGEQEIKPDTNKIEAVFCSKNFQLFVKGVMDDSNEKTTLVCHSLRLVSALDDYLSISHNIQNTCLPINALLAERMTNLFRYKVEEESSRRQRINAIWDQLENFRNF